MGHGVGHGVGTVGHEGFRSCPKSGDRKNPSCPTCPSSCPTANRTDKRNSPVGHVGHEISYLFSDARKTAKRGERGAKKCRNVVFENNGDFSCPTPHAPPCANGRGAGRGRRGSDRGGLVEEDRGRSRAPHALPQPGGRGSGYDGERARGRGDLATTTLRSVLVTFAPDGIVEVAVEYERGEEETPANPGTKRRT